MKNEKRFYKKVRASNPSVTKEKTSMDTNARNGSAPNSLNWNKLRAIKYEYLVTLVVAKNPVVLKMYSGKNSQLTQR